MRTISVTALLCKATEEFVMGFFLTINVPHSVQSLINSHLAQHYPVSQLASYEVLLLSSPNIIFAPCNPCNPETLLPAPQDDDNHDHIMLTA